MKKVQPTEGFAKDQASRFLSTRSSSPLSQDLATKSGIASVKR